MNRIEGICGGNRIVLTENDYITEGGEGKIYGKGSTVYKIYENPAHMIPLGKIQELSVLTQPYIIKPEEVVTSRSGVPIGYSMRRVTDAMTLVSILTKAFRERHQITPDRMLALVRKLQAGVAFIHSKGILIVDLNEWNFLVDKKQFDQIYFIDTNTYQTPSFPATALMESVKDWQAQGTWTTGSDWYSFGIVAFQMLVGIHPFRGHYPPFDHYPKEQRMLKRMEERISTLHAGVTVPAAAYPFTHIPDVYRQWFEAVFEKGLRCAPPDSLQAVVVIQPQVRRIAGSNHFHIEEIAETPGDIQRVFWPVIVASDGVYQGRRRVADSSPDTCIGQTPGGRTIAAHRDKGLLALWDITHQRAVAATVAGEQVMVSDGRFYVKIGTGLYELQFTDLPAHTLCRPAHVANVVENATQLYDGCALQDILGTYFLSVFPEPGVHRQLKIPDLSGYRLVDARYERQVLIVIGAKSGKYDRLVFRFAPDFQSYDMRRTEDIPLQTVNFTVLDNGICALMNEQEELELFSHRKGDPGLKVVADPALCGDCLLYSHGVQGMFARDNKLFKFTMK